MRDFGSDYPYGDVEYGWGYINVVIFCCLGRYYGAVTKGVTDVFPVKFIPAGAATTTGAQYVFFSP